MQTACIEEVGERAAEVIEQKLLEFCRLLRAYGIQVTAGRIIDIFRALQAINVFQRDVFYTALEANVVSRADDRELFRQLFLQFWSIFFQRQSQHRSIEYKFKRSRYKSHIIKTTKCVESSLFNIHIEIAMTSWHP